MVTQIDILIVTVLICNPRKITCNLLIFILTGEGASMSNEQNFAKTSLLFSTMT